MCECSTGGKCAWVKEREDMARSTRFYNRSVRLRKEIDEHISAAQPLRAVDAASALPAEQNPRSNIVPAVEFDTQPRP